MILNNLCKYNDLCKYKKCICIECDPEDSQTFCILYKYGYCKYDEKCKYKHSEYQIKAKYIIKGDNINDDENYKKTKFLLHNLYNNYSIFMENLYDYNSNFQFFNDDSIYRNEINKIQTAFFVYYFKKQKM